VAARARGGPRDRGRGGSGAALERARALHEAAEADRAARPERYALDPDAMLARVLAKTPLAPEDDGDWREGFALYVTAARDEGRLDALGVKSFFVIGGWRTGTTLLQRLLGAAPLLRGAYPSELTVPWRFLGLDEAERRSLIDAGEAAHDLLHLLNPAMQARSGATSSTRRRSGSSVRCARATRIRSGS
jgi:hypothetical protein